MRINKIVFILLIFTSSFFRETLLAANESVLAGKKDELTIAINSEFDTLNPIVNSMMAAIMIQDATLRPLIALKPDGRPYPVLINEIPSLANKSAEFVKTKNSQGLLVKIEFLAKAKWGDGHDLDCQDLKASWQIGIHPNVSVPNRDDYDNIEEISFDPKTPKKCRLKLKEAKWNFPLTLPRPIPAHLELPIFEKYKAEPQGYDRNSLYVREPSQPGLWNGPYRVSQIQLGSHVILQPNQHFFGRTPYFNKVIFKFILNTATLESNLRAHSVDLLSSSALSFDQALTFEKKVLAETLPYRVEFAPGIVYSHIDFNLENSILKDLAVRQALAYAINRKELITAFFGGRALPAFHFSTPFDSWYTIDPKDITTYDYNRSRANQLLEKSGWVRGSDGMRVKGTQKLELVISGATDNKLTEIIEVFVKAALKEIGVDLQIKNYPARVLFAEILRKRKFDLGLYAWVSSPEGSPKPLFHSKLIPSEANSWSGYNRPGWKNLRVDAITENFDREFSETARNKMMRELLKIYTSELPALPLLHRPVNSVIPANLKGFELSGHVYSEYLQIENWEWEQK